MANIWRWELISEDEDGNQEGVSHVHYQTDVPVAGSEPSAAAILDHILDHFSSSGHNMTKWTNAMYSDTRLTQARVRQEVEPGSGDIPEVASEDLSLPGTLSIGTGAQAPSGLALWLKYGTSAAIRSARGGTHIPGGMSVLTLDSGGTWDSGTTYWTNVNTLAASILDKIDNVFDTTGDINPGVYSRTRRARGFEPFFFELESVTPDENPRWLRRRENL
jgi:hypothetical protein